MSETFYAHGTTITITEVREKRRTKTWLDFGLGATKRIDRSRLLCAAIILASLVPLLLLEAHSHPLTNDEIYTLHIAQAPSIKSMLGLAREIDLHPPVHYLAERAALHLALPRWLAARLPNMLAAIVACFCIFQFTARRLGNLFGMVAVSAFWVSPALDFAWTNRPYMLWLAFLAGLLLARDAAARPLRRWWAVPVVFGVTLGMVMTHFLGVACVFPFLVAESLRSRERGRMDWPLVGALTLPLICGVFSFYQLHHLSENAFPADRVPSLDMAVGMYAQLAKNCFTLVTICVVVVVALLGRNKLAELLVEGNGDDQRGASFGVPVMVLLSGLAAVPVLLLLLAMGMHLQFWLRYCLAATPAWSILAAWAVESRLPASRLVALALMLSGVGYMVSRMVGESGPPGNNEALIGGRAPIELANLNPLLPIVAASPMTYVEMSDREPAAVARRVYYLTDRQAALQYAHYTLFENEDKIRRLLQLPSQTEALKPFLNEHKSFYVVGYYPEPEVWLLRKLAADGWKLNYLGKFHSTYESDDLYLVTQ